MTARTLVLVEDDPGDALLVSEMLSDVAADVEVRQFKTLQSALDEWPEEAECVLLDLGLPDAVGLSALQKLRIHVPDVPVVVLTGRLDDASGPGALAAGAQDFLVKGEVDAPGLERALRYAVERGRATTYERQLVAAEVRAEENTRLQRGLLPSPLIETQQLRFAPFYRPGRERALLGGDFYDVVQTDTGVHLLIGDVSGHGLDEAALGVALRIAWRALVLAGLPQEEVLLGVEQVLIAERGDDERFASVATLTIEPDMSKVRLMLCGHPPPLLVQAGEVIELAAEPSPALAIVPGTSPSEITIGLHGDWGLILYTDGLIEGSTAPGDQDRLGTEGLVEHLRTLLGGSIAPEDLAPILLAESERRHGGPLADDVAVLTVGTDGWWA